MAPLVHGHQQNLTLFMLLLLITQALFIMAIKKYLTLLYLLDIFNNKNLKMSYIQINLGGKMRGLKFNQLAIELISTHNDTQTSSGFLYAMIYGGLRGNSYVKREEADYSFEDVCDWVDAMEQKEETIQQITATLTETQIWKSLVNKGNEIIEQEEAGKKKVSKK